MARVLAAVRFIPKSTFFMMRTLHCLILLITAFLATFIRCDSVGDAFDLSFYQKGAAIGDSYAAGIGAGNFHSGFICRRYDGSYSNLVALQIENPKLDFTYTACSGAVIKDVRQQATKLSSGQEFVIVSAGGNDAKLVDILNDCVYHWWGLFSGTCEQTLDRSEALIKGSGIKDGVVDLIKDITAKLAPGGRIYYVGYAKFFDASASACDSVSWHIWLGLFSKQYLTQAKRTRMDQLTEAMNNVLRDTIAQVGGNQVEFIDYDAYVGMVGGRYCQPGVDEDKSRGATRDTLFFYEMKSNDPPWIEDPNAGPHQDLKRRDDNTDAIPEAGSLASQIGALVMLSVNTSKATVNAIDNDNANNDLRSEVDQVDDINMPKRARREVIATVLEHPSGSGGYHASNSNSASHFAAYAHTRSSNRQLASSSASHPTADASSNHPNSHSNGHVVVSPSTDYAPHPRSSHQPSARASRSKVSASALSLSRQLSPAASGTVIPMYPKTSNDSLGINVKIPGVGTLVGSSELGGMVQLQSMASNNSTLYHSNVASTSEGTVIGNSTHLLMADLNIVQKSVITSLFVSDKTLRVFHPTQYGHAIIANAIMYRMAKHRAEVLGAKYFPPATVDKMGEGPLQPTGTACTGDGTSTWADREPMVDALNKFCSDPHNMVAKKGGISSEVYNWNTLDRMNVSVSWDGTGNLGEHSCKSWMRAVTDGCDVPGRGGNGNPGNVKHGGLIQYRSSFANATLSITPLSVRAVFYGGKKTSGQKCNPNDSRYYMDQQTLHNNIEDYCKVLAEKKIGQDNQVFTKIYNEGTPDRVELRTVWPKGPKNFQIYEEECVHYMTAINDGCNVPDVSKNVNPMNWKHGGSFAGNNDILYSITPQYERAPPPDKPRASCKATYGSILYSISFSGGGWNGLTNSDYGRSTVLPSFKRCGSTTSWTFDYFDKPDANGYEWKAFVTLPLFISTGCAGDAIRWAGGPDMWC